MPTSHGARYSWRVPGRMYLGKNGGVYLSTTPEEDRLTMIVGNAVALELSNESADSTYPAGPNVNAILVQNADVTKTYAFTETSHLQDFDYKNAEEQGLILDMTARELTTSYRLFIPSEDNEDTVFFYPPNEGPASDFLQNGWVFKKAVNDAYEGHIFMKFSFDEFVVGQGRPISTIVYTAGHIGIAHCTNSDTISPITAYDPVGADGTLVVDDPGVFLDFVQEIDLKEFTVVQNGQAQFPAGDESREGAFLGFNADDFTGLADFKFNALAEKCISGYDPGDGTTLNMINYDRLIPILWGAVKDVVALSQALNPTVNSLKVNTTLSVPCEFGNRSLLQTSIEPRVGVWSDRGSGTYLARDDTTGGSGTDTIDMYWPGIDLNSEPLFRTPTVVGSTSTGKRSYGWSFKKAKFASGTNGFQGHCFFKFGFGEDVYGVQDYSSIIVHNKGKTSFAHLHNSATTTLVTNTAFTDPIAQSIVAGVPIREFTLEHTPQNANSERFEGSDTVTGSIFGFIADDIDDPGAGATAQTLARKALVDHGSLNHNNGLANFEEPAVQYEALLPILWGAVRNILARLDTAMIA